MTSIIGSCPKVEKKDFSLGADPEFAFIDDVGGVIRADSLITDNEYSSIFGLDGCRRVAELRPKPANEPVQVVNNIRSALLSRRESDPLAYGPIWQAGSYAGKEPIGGHIHFGTLKAKINYDPYHLISCLDAYLGCTAILLETPDQAKSRRRSYGGLGDYRDQPHGIEYRAISSWLTSPYIALGILSLAKAIAWESIYNKLGERIRPYTYTRSQAEDFRLAKYNELRKVFLAESWPDIQKFELYKSYKGPIDLIHLLIVKGRNWFPGTDMKAAWGISKVKINPMPKVKLYDIWSGVTPMERDS